MPQINQTIVEPDYHLVFGALAVDPAGAMPPQHLTITSSARPRAVETSMHGLCELPSRTKDALQCLFHIQIERYWKNRRKRDTQLYNNNFYFLLNNLSKPKCLRCWLWVCCWNDEALTQPPSSRVTPNMWFLRSHQQNRTACWEKYVLCDAVLRFISSFLYLLIKIRTEAENMTTVCL